MSSIWTQAKINPPPKYGETIVYYIDQDRAWLWLKNYEDVLLRDGNPDLVVSLRVGLGTGVTTTKTYQKLAQFPTNVAYQISISNFLSVVDIVSFQQAVLSYAVTNGKQGTSASYYACNLIWAGCRSIGVVGQAAPLPANPDPGQLIADYISNLRDSSYGRDKWKTEPVPGSKYPRYVYEGKIRGLLDPAQYNAYQNGLGAGTGAADAQTYKFVGYFPKPSLVLQEQQTVLLKPYTDDANKGKQKDDEDPDPTKNWNPKDPAIYTPDTKMGATKSVDFRMLTPLESKLLTRIKIKLDLDRLLPDAVQSMLDMADAQIEEKKKEKEERRQGARVATTSSSSTTAPGYLHSQLETVSCYAFRGDSRDPAQVFGAQGFFPNVTRTDPEYLKSFQKEIAQIDQALPYKEKDQLKGPPTVEKGKKKRKEADRIITYLQALQELGVLDLGAYVLSQDFKGYISTTTSIAIAKCFANYYHRYVGTGKEGTTDAEKQAAEKALKQLRLQNQFNTQDFCYVAQVQRGFRLPSASWDIQARKQVHVFASMAEQEVAVPGMVGNNEIVAFRMSRTRDAGPYFDGPVWIRQGLETQDVQGFRQIFYLLSGRTQGLGVFIVNTYRTPPFVVRNPQMPSRQDV